MNTYHIWYVDINNLTYCLFCYRKIKKKIQIKYRRILKFVRSVVTISQRIRTIYMRKLKRCNVKQQLNSLNY